MQYLAVTWLALVAFAIVVAIIKWVKPWEWDWEEVKEPFFIGLGSLGVASALMLTIASINFLANGHFW